MGPSFELSSEMINKYKYGDVGDERPIPLPTPPNF